jgi:hypothetical protein
MQYDFRQVDPSKKRIRGNWVEKIPLSKPFFTVKKRIPRQLSNI